VTSFRRKIATACAFLCPMPCRSARLSWPALFLAGSVGAADLQPYQLQIRPTGDDARDQMLRDASILAQLQDSDPVSPASVIARARLDLDRMQAVLRSQGYYDGQVTLRADGHDITQPDVVTALETRPADPPLNIEASVELGPAYTIDRVEAGGTDGAPLPDKAREALDLASGVPARGADILAAEARVVAALAEDGHAFAKTADRTLTVDHARRTMQVQLRFDPGPRVNLGAVSVEGLDRVDPGFAHARVAAREGKPYSPGEVEGARRDLLDLGVFSAVRARLATQATGGAVPVTLEAVERPPRRLEFGGAYATSEGASLRASWTHRNLFGEAERLTLSAEISNLLDKGTQDYGYRVSAGFAKPDFLQRSQTLRIDTSALRESTDAYDRTAVLASAAVERPLIEHLTGSLGLSFERSRIEEAGETNNYTLIGIPMALVWEDADNPLDSTRGTRGRLEVTPYSSLLGSSVSFTTVRAIGSAYYDLAGGGRSVLAGRVIAQAAVGADRASLPADRRVFAGGGGTIRGFAYQHVGPQRDGTPLGGTTLFAANLEYRQRFGESWGAVAFVDAGGIGAGRAPDWPETLSIGAGLGVRYYSPIGPIRADVAVPLTERPDGDTAWQLYIGIGQAF